MSNSTGGLNDTSITSTLVYGTFFTLLPTTSLPSTASPSILPFTNMTSSNNLTNQTSGPPPNQGPPCSYDLGDWSRALLTLSYIVVFVVAIGGNTLIIYVVFRYRNIKTAFNYLIVNMAAADILDALVACPTSVAMMFTGGIFPSGLLGEIICKLQQMLQVISISASVLTLTVIAADRYLAIVHVMKRPFSVRAVKRTIFCIWFLSGVLFSYELYRMRLIVLPNGITTCGVLWNFGEYEDHLYKTDMLVKLLLHYAFPLFVMMVLYSIILLYLWQRKAPGEFNDSHQRRIERQKRKVVKMLVTIVIVFALCWLPVHVNHMFIAFNYALFQCRLSMGVILLFYMIAHANSAINPCLYLIFNEAFREGFKHIFNKVHRKRITIGERNSTIREVITGATAIPSCNSAYESYTPQLIRQVLNSSISDEMADSRV